MPAHEKEAGLLVSLTAWGMCSSLRVKLLWVVVATWLKLTESVIVRGVSRTLPNQYAVYLLTMLCVLTWVLYKAIPLQKDAKLRSVQLLRARIDLGPA